jgi:hypothetical protein
VFYRLCGCRAYTRLEPDDGKPSSPVLRGGSGSNAVPLPDPSKANRGVISTISIENAVCLWGYIWEYSTFAVCSFPETYEPFPH